MIHKLLITLAALLLTTGLAAQTEKKDNKSEGQSHPGATSSAPSEAKAKKAPIIRVTVPETLKIKDYVFVENKSPYMIARMAVAVDNGDGSYTTVGTLTYVPTGKTVELASFDDNKLKELRGRELLIKIKGYSTPGMPDPFGDENAGEDNREETYDFSVRLSEQNHDLYITVQGASPMDF